MMLLSAIPPFSANLFADVQNMLQFDFMRHALLAGTVLALLAGVVGHFIVLRRQAFAGDALSHVAFAGALGAALFGINPLIGLFGVTLIAALGMSALGDRPRGRDVAIGTVLAWVLGLGVLFLSLSTSGAHGASAIGVNILFGSILGLSASQAQIAAIVGVVALAGMFIIARPLLFASLDPRVAAARGVPVRALGAVFLALVAITVGEATQAVGALLIFALLVTPAAIAQRLTTNSYIGIALSAGLALLFTWVGITIGFYTPLPISFLISALAFVAYLGVVGWQEGTRWWQRRTLAMA